MYDARIIFALSVSFLTDFLTGFATGLGGGVATTATGDTLSIPGLPPKYVWVVALVGGLLAGLRGLQKNISAPLTATPLVISAPPARRAPDA